MTLIEMVLVITVLGATIFVTVPLINSAIGAWSLVTYRSELWQTGGIGMQRMVQEIREIKGVSDVWTADAQTFVFRDVSGQVITYALNGNTIMRNNNALLGNVNAFAFTYYDENGNQIATPRVYPLNTDIRTVRIYFVLGPTGRTFTIQTDVHPRNIN